ncbi:cobalt transporter CbiM [Prosthecochloris sp. N3]|uniref:Cobalt transporter CbiM n=1 Tax=Prosthecochloris ethylica TaxID=2743976 RepID=A0ABR9XSU9_9CHLB|nr:MULTISPECIES: cobalt transporter CbiM [Prosthecochloris]MEC9487052.1 cobalt transporter CbiM [Prosthecochloris sp.]MBF0585372.1 cobalt transporter CbiM [Prosthecochloris ethylica]MBF0636908.1 cobalt transporter CbiM [Prosthecochloris ethylica]NUK46601.1 cobalt transporter CbiM [Prosthecochloris ethylica]RNA64785.1 cobalt transporter CbiM [Prosthecochloris sp. ZM_2]
MHISEGVLPLPALAIGYAVAAVGTATGLKKLRDDDIVRTALMSCAFFTASFIHIPLGPASVHLVLNGLTGILCGWSSFVALGIALLLQAVLFQYGGITTLGVNTAVMALPAVACFLLFSPLIRSRRLHAVAAGFLTGTVSVLLSALLLSITLLSAGDAFLPTARLVFVSNVPLMIADGLLTGLILQFIITVKPELLEP